MALLDQEIHPFEFGVACEVFGIDRSDEGLPTFDFAVCAATSRPIPTVGGASVRASHGLDRAATADLVVIPAWHTRDERPRPDIVRVLNEAVERGATVVSVCTGAFLAAAAGLLDGRRATTHWLHADAFTSRFPNVRLEPDRLYVEDGPIITSAGTAAGVDACLYLVRRELGAHVANRFARRMVVPAHRDGGQSQYIETPVPPRRGHDDMAKLLGWMQANLRESMSVQALAARVHMAPRTFARRFVAATGTTPNQWLVRQRVLLAQRLLEERNLTVEEIAVRTGFGTADLLRHHFAQQIGTSPLAYRRMFNHQEVRA